MNLSKKSRYGLRALIDLAANTKEEHKALSVIAECNHISPQYLEQIFSALRKNGLLKSVKGAQGGYFLAKKPEEITVSEILEAIDGSYRIEAEEAGEEDEIRAVSAAIQSTVIDRVNEQLDGLLKGITLADLEAAYGVYRESGQEMYYI